MRPAFYLNLSAASVQSGNGTKESPYTVAGGDTPAISFTDVASNAYYADPVAWSVEFMWKHAGSPDSAAASFSDVSSPAVD